MSFENARKGLKQVYRGELLELLAAIAGGALSFAGNMAEGVKNAGDTGKYDLFIKVAAIRLVIGMVLTALASLLKVLGISKASSDNKSFGHALIFILINLIVSLGSSLLNKWGISEDTMSLVKGICNTFTMVFVVDGIISLARKVGNETVEKTGKRAVWYILAVEVCAAAVNILAHFITKNSELFWIPAVIGIVTMILYVISYIVYLKTLRKGANML